MHFQLLQNINLTIVKLLVLYLPLLPPSTQKIRSENFLVENYIINLKQFN